MCKLMVHNTWYNTALGHSGGAYPEATQQAHFVAFWKPYFVPKMGPGFLELLSTQRWKPFLCDTPLSQISLPVQFGAFYGLGVTSKDAVYFFPPRMHW